MGAYRVRNLWLLVVLTLVGAAPVVDQSHYIKVKGFTYLHRAGASAEEHDADVRDCAKRSLTMPFQSSAINFGGLLGSALAEGYNRQTTTLFYVTNVRNCMLLRGWELVLLPDERGQDIADQLGRRDARELGRLVGAPEIEGQLVYRPRDDDARRGHPVLPDNPKEKSLSLMAVGALPQSLRFGQMRRYSGLIKPVRDLSKVRPDSTLIVVQTASPYTFHFMQLGPPGEGVGPVVSEFGVGVPATGSGSNFTQHEVLYLFEAPPGYWRIAGSGGIDFCLGAPAFELKPGQAVYAGSLRGGPDGPLNLDPGIDRVRASLPAAVAERLEPANYVNGATHTCGLGGPSLITTLFFPGYPAAVH